MNSNGQFKIEDGIPLPPKTTNSLAAALRQIAVGQSVFAAGRKLRDVSSQACHLQKTTEDARKFTCRTVDGGVRVWRIA
jgi:hypothetical protein